MKTSIRFGLVMALAFGAGAAAWIGCSSSSSTDSGGTGTDAGGSGSKDSGGTNPGTDGSMPSGTDSGGGGTTDAGGGSQDAAIDTGLTSTCKDYCDWSKSKCTMPDDTYPSDEVRCQKVCADFAPGADSDMSGDTVGCRVNYLIAAGDAGPNCQKSGPYGGNACGTECKTFCNLALKQCAGQFADETACENACGGFAVTGVPITSTGPAGGNSFECRAYHLQAAFDDPATHCGHIITASPVCQ